VLSAEIRVRKYTNNRREILVWAKHLRDDVPELRKKIVHLALFRCEGDFRDNHPGASSLHRFFAENAEAFRPPLQKPQNGALPAYSR